MSDSCQADLCASDHQMWTLAAGTKGHSFSAPVFFFFHFFSLNKTNKSTEITLNLVNCISIILIDVIISIFLGRGQKQLLSLIWL